MKAIYKNKTSGDIFAIETDEKGNVVKTCGPLMFNDLDPQFLSYDDYWNMDVSSHLKDFERLTKTDYLEILRQNGFSGQSTQSHLF